jgi:hypothetical protein
LVDGDLTNQADRDQKELESLNRRKQATIRSCEPVAARDIRKSPLGAVTERVEKWAFKVDYLSYILAILVIGLVCIAVVRFATRSQNPDLLLQYMAREKAARQAAARQSDRYGDNAKTQPLPVIKSLRERHQEKIHYRTPWGWPGSQKEIAHHQGITETVRSFTDRLVREKQLVQSNAAAGNGSIRALLEDRYGPVNRGMKEIPYQRVKRPLLRDPSEQHDQLDNLGSAEVRQLRKKLQFLSAMTSDELAEGQIKSTKKVAFRYVELKDLKQPWGW